MQKYIKPVRAMLGQYKQSISNMRENQRIITRSTDVSNDENICPNLAPVEQLTKRRQKNITNHTNSYLHPHPHPHSHSVTNTNMKEVSLK